MPSLKKALQILSADFLEEQMNSVRSAAEKLGIPSPISVRAVINNIPDFAPGTMLTQDILNSRNLAFSKYIALGGVQGPLGRIIGPILVLADGKNVVLKCEGGFVVSTDVGMAFACGGGGGGVPTHKYELTLEKIRCDWKRSYYGPGGTADHIWMRLIMMSTMQENGAASDPLVYNIKDMTFGAGDETTPNLQLYSGDLPFLFTLSLLGIETNKSDLVSGILDPFEETTEGNPITTHDLGGSDDEDFVNSLTEALKYCSVIEAALSIPFAGTLPIGVLIATICDAVFGGPVVVARSSFIYNSESFDQFAQYSAGTEDPNYHEEEYWDIQDIHYLWRRYYADTNGDIMEVLLYAAESGYPSGPSYELTFRHHVE